MKRTIPLLITFVVGVVLIFAYFVPHPPFNRLREDFNVFFDILASFAFILGGGNLLKVHLDKAWRKKSGWGYSVVTIAVFLATLAVGLLKIGPTGPERWQADVQGAGQGLWFTWIYENTLVPLSSTMFALLAFYVASASYRAFRAKNVEATVLLVTAFVILLGRTFIGALATAWLPKSLEAFTIPAIANWIMAAPNLVGNRAIMIGIALGIVATSLKVIIGVDRSYLGGEE